MFAFNNDGGGDEDVPQFIDAEQIKSLHLTLNARKSNIMCEGSAPETLIKKRTLELLEPKKKKDSAGIGGGNGGSSGGNGGGGNGGGDALNQITGGVCVGGSSGAGPSAGDDSQQKDKISIKLKQKVEDEDVHIATARARLRCLPVQPCLGRSPPLSSSSASTRRGCLLNWDT
ncbi:hypothetical protein Pcinc_010816 [Petrolisthes cinctipes]|uniref:Uncharacterized protein n=1 Tax=Petrolisthes cinctipes TaxID=88211 RepID=A0AAE1G8C3_PETCI|nr:hypothetical protein Pcinc_010816 [Petrolisthes cinctipes]